MSLIFDHAKALRSSQSSSYTNHQHLSDLLALERARKNDHTTLVTCTISREAFGMAQTEYSDVQRRMCMIFRCA